MNLNKSFNDLTSYANWLYEYGPSGVNTTLKKIFRCEEASDYEDILRSLADQCFNPQDKMLS